VKKLWKTWRDDRDKTTATTATATAEEPPRGKAKEAKKESRVRRMKRRAQRKSVDRDDNDEAETETNDEVNDNDNTVGSEEAEEEVSVDDDVPPPIAEDVDMKAPVWDYVMASAAAPIVFPSFKVPYLHPPGALVVSCSFFDDVAFVLWGWVQKHIDAGVMCNAPALTAAVTVMGANMEDPQRCVAVSLAMPSPPIAARPISPPRLTRACAGRRTSACCPWARVWSTSSSTGSSTTGMTYEHHHPAQRHAHASPHTHHSTRTR
jgi:hypothetical protein